MILDGERIKHLLAQARTEVIICAPFIKLEPFKLLLESVPSNVPVTTVTRWNPNEIMMGVSDLEVFDVVNAQENAKLLLVDRLHAKLFCADEHCLAGSANITGAALGWSKKSNLELLIEVSRNDHHVQWLIKHIMGGKLATNDIRLEMEKEAEIAKAQFQVIDDIKAEQEIVLAKETRVWLPKCAAPDRLFQVYRNPKTSSAGKETIEDALSDLQDLMPAPNLSEEEFSSYISYVLHEMPAFKKVIDKAAERINDDQGKKLLLEIVDEIDGLDINKQWLIVRDWIKVFLQDLEVAPETFSVRLKSR